MRMLVWGVFLCFFVLFFELSQYFNLLFCMSVWFYHRIIKFSVNYVAEEWVNRNHCLQASVKEV